ncbi:hypothetical protein [Nonlabens tegetincola]|uniref:hypothetical protein n=1 Tax=Nonlabens tegetincola TaxID=323273 RepID=UPI000CF4F78D|nr:hypothetical protein [Nonlabens tegetincola]PQJ16891.1 hypothetical protein BST93_09420 [Nonlabens tegetincola]
MENTNGTVTYTDEAGNDTIIDVTNLETLTEIAENTDGTFTYTDEDGVDTIIDISNLETLTLLAQAAGNTDAEVPLVMLIPLLRIPMRMFGIYYQ